MSDLVIIGNKTRKNTFLGIASVGNTNSFEEISQRWQAVFTLDCLTVLRIEILTSRSRSKRVTQIKKSNLEYFSGILAILGGAIGQLVGGALISKYDIKIKWMMHICYISPLIAMFCSLCYLITCSNPSKKAISHFMYKLLSFNKNTTINLKFAIRRTNWSNITVTRSCMEREVWDSNLGPVKSGTVSSQNGHRGRLKRLANAATFLRKELRCRRRNGAEMGTTNFLYASA